MSIKFENEVLEHGENLHKIYNDIIEMLSFVEEKLVTIGEKMPFKAYKATNSTLRHLHYAAKGLRNTNEELLKDIEELRGRCDANK